MDLCRPKRARPNVQEKKAPKSKATLSKIIPNQPVFTHSPKKAAKFTLKPHFLIFSPVHVLVFDVHERLMFIR